MENYLPSVIDIDEINGESLEDLNIQFRFPDLSTPVVRAEEDTQGDDILDDENILDAFDFVTNMEK